MKKIRPVNTPGHSLRRLTVQSLMQQSGSGCSWRPCTYLRPWIRLSGRWLADAGFAEGDRIVVRAGSGRITIEKEQPLLPLP